MHHLLIHHQYKLIPIYISISKMSVDYSQIVQHIFIGNVTAAIGNYQTKDPDILEKEQIPIVISALTEEEYERHMITKDDFPNCEWHRLVIDDTEDEDISIHFYNVHQIISKATKENKNVLIHCSAGISRSPALVIAYLMIEYKWTYDQALKLVSKRRNIIQPNKGFVMQLSSI
jgi:protein-tyrosine phosphatase